jgi:hypothetical protein
MDDADKPDEDAGTNGPRSRRRPRTIAERWKATSLSNKLLVWTSIIVAVGTLGQVLGIVYQIRLSKSFAEEQEKSATRAAERADTQTTRLIAAAERLAKSSESANSANQEAVSRTLDQGRQAIEVSVAATRQTAKLVHTAQEAFAAAAMPVVKFKRYQWFTEHEKTSCERPAHGLNVYYHNVSAVPVRIIDTDLIVRSGSRKLGVALSPKVPTGTKILATHDEIAHGVLPPGFRDAYAAVHPQAGNPQYLNFELAVIYQSLTTHRCYKYLGTATIRATCDLPNQQQAADQKDSLTEIACAK